MPRLSLFKSIASPGLRFGGAALQFVATLLIARTFGASRAGDFFFWSSIFRITGQASTFGLDRLSLQQVPRIEESPAALSRFVATVRVTILIVSAVSASLVIAYAILVNPDDSRPWWWYSLPPACIAGVALCMLNGDVMTGRGRPTMGVIFRHTLPTAAFVLTLLFTIHLLGTNQLLACFTITFLIAGSGALIVPGFTGAGPHFRIPSAATLSSHLRQGFPIFLSTIFTSLTFLIPLALLERHHSPDKVAYLITAFRISVLFEVLSMAVHAMAMPHLSREGQSCDPTRRRKIYKSSIIKGTILLGPPMILTLILAGSITSIFGEEFRQAGAVLRTFLAFGLVSLACGPASHLVLMVGKTGYMARNAFGRLAITAVLSLFLIPAFGPIGMAVALGVGLLLEKGLCLLHY